MCEPRGYVNSLMGAIMKKDPDPGSILLTQRELQIMKVIWHEGSATVRYVHNAISQNKAPTYSTILTIMNILEKKGVLGHTQSGRAFVYRPILSRQQATRNYVRDVIARFFDGRPDRLITDMLDNDIWAPEQLRNAKNILDSWQENRASLSKGAEMTFEATA
jgi:predicted transcriptional regulator